jgi:hypothetical protein
VPGWAAVPNFQTSFANAGVADVAEITAILAASQTRFHIFIGVSLGGSQANSCRLWK